MYYLIIILIMIALISIAYVWYFTRGKNIVSDDQLLQLHTDEDKVLSSWYQANNKSSLDFGIDDNEIAATFIERMLNKKVKPEHIVIGRNLEEQYYKFTGIMPDQNIFVDTRDLIGKSYQFLIISDNKLRERFIKEDINLNELNDIMLNNLDEGARNYLIDLLNVRWGMIEQLNDDDIVNKGGSYLYIKVPDNSTENEITVRENILAANTAKGARINLLCNNWEFETLMKRLKQKSQAFLSYQ